MTLLLTPTAAGCGAQVASVNVGVGDGPSRKGAEKPIRVSTRKLGMVLKWFAELSRQLSRAQRARRGAGKCPGGPASGGCRGRILTSEPMFGHSNSTASVVGCGGTHGGDHFAGDQAAFGGEFVNDGE